MYRIEALSTLSQSCCSKSKLLGEEARTIIRSLMHAARQCFCPAVVSASNETTNEKNLQINMKIQ